VCDGQADHKATMPIDAKTFRETTHGSVYECVNCALGFVHPRPTPAQTASFYQLDAYYTQGASHMVRTPAPRILSRLRTHLAWRLDQGTSLCNIIEDELAPRCTIVDIGCGSGSLMKDLAARGHRVTGVERDAASVSRHEPSLRVLEGSAEALPRELEPASCDGVVFSHVIEHLVDPVRALADAAALLKPKGLVFCEVPNNEALIARQSGLAWEHLDIPRHLNFFTERSLAALVRNAGLVVRRVYFSGYCRYFDDSYIATEQRIYDRLAAMPGGAHGATRNSAGRAWRLLARTALAPARVKYDSVGIVAGWPPALM
jgi:2-polyprenyl-3-methyl-5-hydroxy-6-metoxy-1,4-benzoquinol methylase